MKVQLLYRAPVLVTVDTETNAVESARVVVEEANIEIIGSAWLLTDDGVETGRTVPQYAAFTNRDVQKAIAIAEGGDAAWPAWEFK